MVHVRFSAMLVLVLTAMCVDSAAEEPPSRVDFYYTGNVGSPLPRSSLPAHVVAPDGELTLFADYADFAANSVVLYLVNRTRHRIGFSSQDDDVYVKLECEVEEGQWERAQSHRSSWCGNSYMVFPVLRSGEYFRFSGYLPSNGEARPVRYRMYEDSVFILDNETNPYSIYMRQQELDKLPVNLVSNVGTGRVRTADIDAARRDGFRLALGNFELIRDLASRATDGVSTILRREAVAMLEEFAIEEAFDLAKGLLDDPDEEVVVAATRALVKMGLKTESAECLYQELLQSDDVKVRRNATFALRERPITPEVVRVAKEWLTDDDLVIRVYSAGLLAGLCKDDPEMKAFINSIYDDLDPKIQSVFETVLFPSCINYQERGRKGRFRDYDQK